MPIDFKSIPSPCFLLDERKLHSNLELIKKVQDEAEVSVILAFKGFAMWGAFSLVKEYIGGAAASSLYEARLSFEEMGVKAHTYAPVYRSDEFDEILNYSDKLTFNSIDNFNQFKDRIPANVSCGIRVNPEYSEVETALYNPADPTSRLGMTSTHFRDKLPEGIEGLHFHVLCESGVDELERTLTALEQKFGPLLQQAKWVNMGGGHLITKKGYDTNRLIKLLRAFKLKYDVEVILEPGSAFAWETGYLVSSVLDIVENGGVKTAMLDVSFTAHMPDCLEMPYKPEILGAFSEPKGNQPTYRMGGSTCLAGDYMSEYTFDQELNLGDRIVFNDMMHYTMVKTTMFNGIQHPSIGVWTEQNEFKLIREFTYEDYKNRLS
jgi:carboxynorspermidine decarboxylase